MRCSSALLALALGVLCVGPSAAAAEDGAKLYEANCAKCHGADGSADTPVGKAMKAHPLKDPKFAKVEAAAVIQAVRENPKHKAVAEKVSDADLTAIAGHIRELAGGSGE
jgi:cytochrome c6